MGHRPPSASGPVLSGAARGGANRRGSPTPEKTRMEGVAGGGPHGKPAQTRSRVAHTWHRGEGTRDGQTPFPRRQA